MINMQLCSDYNWYLVLSIYSYRYRNAYRYSLVNAYFNAYIESFEGEKP